METRVTKKKYFNIIITLIAISTIPIYLYGVEVIRLIFSALATAIVTDWLCVRIFKKQKHDKGDVSYIITALVIALFLPATAPWWIATAAVVVGIVIAKYPFGGTGHNIFNPAAVGLCFVSICWPDYVLKYPVPHSIIDFATNLKIPYEQAPGSVLKLGGVPQLDFFDILLGDFAGPMGTTCIIVLLCCLLYLIFRRTINIKIFLMAVITISAFSAVFPRILVGENTIPLSIMYELCSGGLIFGLIYMANDPVTAPDTRRGQILYGVLLGIIIMVFRYFGTIELEFVYAILLANIFAIPCDRYANFITNKANNVINKLCNKKDKN
ncbi:MAG: RnfABCDGE type electron transport complex subunit D [Oscillospiraceae bacterium]